MGAPTAKLETVVVNSPIKSLSYLFNIIAAITCMLIISSSFWFIEDSNTRYGLWQQCEIHNSSVAEMNDDNQNNDQYVKCHLYNKVWTQLCGALVVVATLCAVLGCVLIYLGFNHQERQDHKMKYYRSALFCHFVGFLCLVLSLTIFPLYFINELEEENESTWYFGWSYGAGWGASIFLFASGILLICDRNREEVFYKETLYLNQEDQETAEA